MNVCILTATRGWGGVEVHTTGLARYLVRKGHKVVIVQVGHDVYGNVGFVKREKVEVIRINTAKHINDFGWFECFRILSKVKADVCVFAKGGLLLANWRLDFAARVSFPRYITIEHGECPKMPVRNSARHLGGFLPGIGLWWLRILLRRYMRSVAPHRIISVSSTVRDQLVEYYHFQSRKVVAVRNGIDTNRFQRFPGFRRTLRTEWRIPEDACVFGAIGRLSREKNYNVALELFAELVSTIPERDLRLVVVGDGPLYGTLRRTIEDAGLNDRVILTGFYDRPWQVYSAIDIFLMPSQNEGLPLALLEAMASSCCPIAMAVGGIPEVISDRRLGWLVQPGDRTGFFQAMREAAESDPEKLEEMGRRARRSVVSDFNAQKQFLKLVDLIEKESAA